MANEPFPPVGSQPAESPFEPEVEEFHLAKWLNVIRRRIGLLVVAVVVVLGYSVVKYFITPKEYSATCLIQIERRAPGTVSVEGGFNFDSWVDVQSFLPTQIRLLQSRGLAERVVRDLRLFE